MRRVLIILLLLAALPVWSQTTYTSNYTQHWPTIFNTEIEKINRSISFEENSITLATETRNGKEIETFYIQKIDEVNGAVEFVCLTNDKQLITILIPARPERVGYIDIFRPSRKNGEEVQLRLYLN